MNYFGFYQYHYHEPHCLTLISWHLQQLVDEEDGVEAAANDQQ